MILAIDWQTFTVSSAFAALVGGLMIGLAAVWLAWTNGRIAGISGILGYLIEMLVRHKRDVFGWRVVFILGLIGGPVLWKQFANLPSVTQQTSSVGLIVGGLLVGVGTRYANGCTSGHGICGLSRFSTRSLVAVLTFMGSAMLTVYLIRHILDVL